jgi:outer membrane protein assembly factor BamB
MIYQPGAYLVTFALLCTSYELSTPSPPPPPCMVMIQFSRTFVQTGVTMVTAPLTGIILLQSCYKYGELRPRLDDETPATGEDPADDLKRKNRCRIEATASASSDGSRIFVGNSNHRLYCLSADTGDTIWTYLTGEALKCTPAIVPSNDSSQDLVVFPSYDRKLYCLRNGSSPIKMWTAGTGFTNISTIFLSFFYLFSKSLLNCF